MGGMGCKTSSRRFSLQKKCARCMILFLRTNHNAHNIVSQSKTLFLSPKHIIVDLFGCRSSTDATPFSHHNNHPTLAGFLHDGAQTDAAARQ